MPLVDGGLPEFDGPLFDEADPRLLRRFAKYHAENPNVFAEFETYARRIAATGRQRYSAWVIIQVIRWDYDIRTTGEVFQINNDFIALYARLLITRVPWFASFLELRKMKSTRKLSEEDADRQNVPQTPYQGPQTPVEGDHETEAEI